MVYSDIKMIVAIPLDRRRDEVLERHIAIRRRIECRYSTADRIDELIRNLVSWKRLLGEGIDWRCEQALRKVTVPLCHRRHIRDSSYSLPDARTLIVGEKECPILHDRPANSASKLISLVPRRRFAGGRKEIPRIQCAVSKELIAAAVHRIRS